MIRPTRTEDFDGLMAIATSSGLFEPDQADFLSHLINNPGEGDTWFTDEEGGRPVGVAYLAPEKMTNGTWNLYWIAVDPSFQRQGRGKAILEHVQNWLIQSGQRVLLVETSGTDDFDYVRTFYATNGFEAEATIRDFYEAGIDKVIFRKSLASQSPPFSPSAR